MEGVLLIRNSHTSDHAYAQMILSPEPDDFERVNIFSPNPSSATLLLRHSAVKMGDQTVRFAAEEQRGNEAEFA
jgi:hypothetical protein